MTEHTRPDQHISDIFLLIFLYIICLSDFLRGIYCAHIASLADTQIGEMEPSPVEIAEYIHAPNFLG